LTKENERLKDKYS